MKYPFPAYSGDDPYVFVSYAHDDADQVFSLIEQFHAAGYNAWYDDAINPGAEWPAVIQRAVTGCSLFVVFLTTRSERSMNVRNEINLALKHRLPCVPIVLEAVDLADGLDLQLSSTQSIMRYLMDDDTYERRWRDAFARSGIPTSSPAPGGANVASVTSSPTPSDPLEEAKQLADRSLRELHDNQLDASLADAKRSLTIRREKLGSDNPRSIYSIHLVIYPLVAQKKYAEAEPLCQELVERTARAKPLDAVDVVSRRDYWAFVLRHLGRHSEADRVIQGASADLAALDGAARGG